MPKKKSSENTRPIETKLQHAHKFFHLEVHVPFYLNFWRYIQIFWGAMFPLTLHLGVQRKWTASFSFHMSSFCICCCFFLSIWNKISICCCFECIIWTLIFWCLKFFGRLGFFAGVGTGSLTLVTLLLGSALSSSLLLSWFS